MHASFCIDVLIKIVHRLLCLVQSPEHHVNEDTCNETRNAESHKHPQDRRIVRHWNQCLANRRTKRVSEKVERLNEGLHRRRRLGVCVLETCDRRKDLRDADKHICGGLDGDVNVVPLSGTVNDGGVAEWRLVARPMAVDQVLDNGCIHHGYGSHPEAEHDSVDRRERNLGFS